MVLIRRGTAEDADNLAAFASWAYEQAFGGFTHPDDLAEFLSERYGGPQQRTELTSEDVITLIVEIENRIVGFSQVRRSPAPACVTGEMPIELWRFYIHPGWHGRGVAQELLRETRTAAGELGGRTLWLSVWGINARGIAFYAKSGFRDVGAREFWVGKDCQSDRIMVTDL